MSDVEPIILLVIVWAPVVILACAVFVISATVEFAMAKECRGKTL